MIFLFREFTLSFDLNVMYFVSFVLLKQSLDHTNPSSDQYCVVIKWYKQKGQQKQDFFITYSSTLNMFPQTII